MKIDINFTLEYEKPGSLKDYKEIIKAIKNYYENEMQVPTTDNVKFKSIDVIGINIKIQ